MPHKHTRRDKDKDPSAFDLPPTQVAKPLPVAAAKQVRHDAKKKDGPGVKKDLKRKRSGAKSDDVPRAFKRLMAFAGGKKVRNGLDDGTAQESKKKRKQKNGEQEAEAAKPAETTAVPTIRPGERFSDFSARVDAALPLGGLISKSVKNGKDPLGLKVQRTRKERKMHKMYDEWREEDRKIKERRQEELEQAEEQDLEDEEKGIKWDQHLGGDALSKKKKKGKKGRFLGEVADGDDDPWAEIKKKRGESRIGLHDIAKAPPELKLPRKKMTVGGATVDVENIPKAAGSLRRREELQSVREEVLTAYRNRMASRRPDLQH